MIKDTIRVDSSHFQPFLDTDPAVDQVLGVDTRKKLFLSEAVLHLPMDIQQLFLQVLQRERKCRPIARSGVMPR